MGDFGVVASRYHANARLLREFDEALGFLKQHENAGKVTMDTQTQKLLAVLKPIQKAMDENLSDSLTLDDSEIVSILHQRHSSDWQTFQSLLLQITQKLEKVETPLSKNEFDVLNDVADALDTRCTHLFRRMGGG